MTAEKKSRYTQGPYALGDLDLWQFRNEYLKTITEIKLPPHLTKAEGQTLGQYLAAEIWPLWMFIHLKLESDVEQGVFEVADAVNTRPGAGPYAVNAGTSIMFDCTEVWFAEHLTGENLIVFNAVLEKFADLNLYAYEDQSGSVARPDWLWSAVIGSLENKCLLQLKQQPLTITLETPDAIAVLGMLRNKFSLTNSENAELRRLGLIGDGPEQRAWEPATWQPPPLPVWLPMFESRDAWKKRCYRILNASMNEQAKSIEAIVKTSSAFSKTPRMREVSDDLENLAWYQIGQMNAQGIADALNLMREQPRSGVHTSYSRAAEKLKLPLRNAFKKISTGNT